MTFVLSWRPFESVHETISHLNFYIYIRTYEIKLKKQIMFLRKNTFGLALGNRNNTKSTDLARPGPFLQEKRMGRKNSTKIHCFD